MHMKKSVVWLRTALNAVGTTAGGAMAMGLMAAAPVQTVHAQTTTACAAAWSSTTAYSGGAVVSENGINYVANWWTQGNDPASNCRYDERAAKRAYTMLHAFFRERFAAN